MQRSRQSLVRPEATRTSYGSSVRTIHSGRVCCIGHPVDALPAPIRSNHTQGPIGKTSSHARWCQLWIAGRGWEKAHIPVAWQSVTAATPLASYSSKLRHIAQANAPQPIDRHRDVAACRFIPRAAPRMVGVSIAGPLKVAIGRTGAGRRSRSALFLPGGEERPWSYCRSDAACLQIFRSSSTRTVRPKE